MKRLLCIVSSLDAGGAETFLMKLYRCIPDGYKIDFIVSKESGFYEDEVKSLGGVIHRIPLRTKSPIRAFQDIKRIVSENKYGYVLKLCDTPIGFFDLLAAKCGGAKQLCVRSCNADSSEGKIKKTINAVLRPMFNKISTVKIAPSQLAAEYTFGKKTVEKGLVNFLHNAIDLNEYSFSQESRDQIRKEFSIGKNTLVIGHIGRFNYQKNHEFLISVFKEVHDNNPDSKLIMVGNGELEKKIQELVKENRLEEATIFTGIRKDVPKLLSAIDILLLPSLFEGMPNTIIEGQASGVDCVLSDRITTEAQITNLVRYCSINSKSEWVNLILSINPLHDRQSFRQDLEDAGYNIDNVVKEFINMIFE